LGIPAVQIRLRLLDAGTLVVRVLLLPVAFSLACLALLVFGLVAKYADLRE
jgi:hypothetical protein